MPFESAIDFFNDFLMTGGTVIAIVDEDLFIEEKMYTENEGLVEFIDQDTYLVEEQNSGILWVIRNDTVIYKDIFRSQHEGHHHLPNWTRIVSE